MRTNTTSCLERLLDCFPHGLSIDMGRSSRIDDVVWPEGSTYLAYYSLKTDLNTKTEHVAFFKNAQYLSNWYSGVDAMFELDALYMWDLGPLLIEDYGPHLKHLC